MKTKGIVTSQHISDYTRERGGFLKVTKDVNSELDLKSMLISCFTYGGCGKDSYNFEQYIAPYQKDMSKKLFDEIYSEMNEYFKRCEIKHGVYTDAEGCTYNELTEV